MGGHKGVGARGGGGGGVEGTGTGTLPVFIVVAADAVAECFAVIALSSFICPGTLPAAPSPLYRCRCLHSTYENFNF